jgi:peptidoglycan/LPS O-acetylase OafA/YrhL
MKRFEVIDGLRGIAALMVAAFHLFKISENPSHALAAAKIVTRHGWLGVPVFFVISGFVIAHSLRGSTVTGRYAAQYALRRSLRLDPPYWTAILLTIAFGGIAFYLTQHEYPRPTPALLAAHAVYLQNILNLPSLSSGLWTLCLEVQFYASFLLLLAVSQRLRIRLPWIILPLAAASLLLDLKGRPSDPSVLWNADRCLIPNFSLFGVGIVTWLFYDKQISAKIWVVFMALVAARLAWWYQSALVAGLVTGALIAVGVRRPLLPVANPVTLFLGKISYSLYLIHFLSGTTFLALCCPKGAYESLAWCSAALGAAILAAWVMNIAVEQPSIELAKRVAKLKSAAPDTSGLAAN